MSNIAIMLCAWLILTTSCIAPIATQPTSTSIIMGASTDDTGWIEQIFKPSIPESTLHTISLQNIYGLDLYWNPFWSKEDAGVLPNEAMQIDARYLSTHPYINGKTDRNELAIAIWNKLMESGIVSIIVAGNLDQDKYEFSQCNHAWLLIFRLPKGKSKPTAFALEPTNGKVYFEGDAAQDANINHYWSGFFYALPSHLRKDLNSQM
jgi:hypothetical protein